MAKADKTKVTKRVSFAHLHKLSAVNLPALRGRVNDDLLNRVSRLVGELIDTFGGVRATLGDIPRRVDGLVAESRKSQAIGAAAPAPCRAPC